MPSDTANVTAPFAGGRRSATAACSRLSTSRMFGSGYAGRNVDVTVA
jgi:hypothetical protein